MRAGGGARGQAAGARGIGSAPEPERAPGSAVPSRGARSKERAAGGSAPGRPPLSFRALDLHFGGACQVSAHLGSPAPRGAAGARVASRLPGPGVSGCWSWSWGNRRGAGVRGGTPRVYVVPGAARRVLHFAGGCFEVWGSGGPVGGLPPGKSWGASLEVCKVCMHLCSGVMRNREAFRPPS